MKVAIMGAGLSGLACAIELEKNGVEPVIFERRSMVSDRFVNAEVMISLFSRPVRDEIEYLSEKHHIDLQPTSNITKFVLASAHRRAQIEGRIGFCNIRGRHHQAFEHQLKNQLHTTNIVYHSQHTYEELLSEYTHVIVATGDPEDASEIAGFDTELTACLMGRTVEGHFSVHTVYSWFDTRFAPKGYGYLIPYSDREANLVIGFPDDPKLSPADQEVMWRKFQSRVESDLNQSLKTTDSFHIHGYPVGIVRYPRIGNTFFVGNNFCTMMPLFGFGQFPAILTGIYAARDICGQRAYEESVKGIRQSYYASAALRRAFEQFDNNDFDFLVQRLEGSWGDWLMNTKHDVLKWASYAVRLWEAARIGTP